MTDVTKILTELANIKAVLISGYTVNGKKFPPIKDAVEQTGPVFRSGAIFTLRQEVADSKTMLLALTAKTAAQDAVLKQLAAATGTTIDYARIDAGVKAALADGIKIEGTITTGGTEE